MLCGCCHFCLGSTRWTRGVVFLAQLPICSILFCVFLLILSLTFHELFYKPCSECYSFEASVAHEIGHVLGFSHPDMQAARNLQLPPSVLQDSAACEEPLKHVTLDPMAVTREDNEAIM